jgi:CRISPR type III-associated protein (TIGR04423 family)
MEMKSLDMEIKSLDMIPTDYHYEGYLWLSDKQIPEIIDGKVDFSEYIKKQNPFIIEGLLWAEAEQVSIHIKHTHRYLVNKVCLKDFPKESQKDKKYHAHRIVGYKYLKFKQIWLPEPDEFCNNFEVLTMKTMVFVGF